MTRFLIPAALAAAALSVSAKAQEASVYITYDDLDLTSETGVVKLDRRIDSAVDLVCENRIGQIPLRQAIAVRKCAADAWSNVEGPRQLVIERARGRVPSVEIAGAKGKAGLAVRRR